MVAALSIVLGQWPSALAAPTAGPKKAKGSATAKAGALPALPPDLVAPDVQMDKELSQELQKGSLLDQLERSGKLAKRITPAPTKLLQPYLAGSLEPAVAYELIESNKPFVDAPAAEGYAQAIANKLAAKVAHPGFQVRVKVVADPSYGAEATESGLIFLRLGTLNKDNTKGAATSDELALLLGHEIGHVLLGDVEARKQARALGRLVAYASTGVLAYSAVKDGKMVNGQFQGEPDADLLFKGLLTGLATNTLLEDLLAPSFHRRRELEADRIGIDLARRAGYVVSEGEAMNFVSKHGEAALRHSQRVDALRGVIDLLVQQFAVKMGNEAGQNNPWITAMIAVPAKLATEKLTSFIVQQTKEHPDPEERKSFVARYIKQNYGDGDTAPDGRLLKRDQAGLYAICGDPTLSNLVTQVRLASEVRDVLNKTLSVDDPGPSRQQAWQQLRSAGFASGAAAPQGAAGKKGAKPTASAPPRARGGFGIDAAAMTWEMQGMLHATDGDMGLAATAWRRGLRSNYASVEMARNLAKSQSGPSSTERDAIIARFATLVGTTDPVLDLVVASEAAKGNVAAAEVAAARCVTYADGKLYTACSAGLGYNPLVKDQPARTPEGQKAFASKGLEKSFKDLGKITSFFQ